MGRAAVQGQGSQASMFSLQEFQTSSAGLGLRAGRKEGPDQSPVCHGTYSPWDRMGWVCGPLFEGDEGGSQGAMALVLLSWWPGRGWPWAQEVVQPPPGSSTGSQASIGSWALQGRAGTAAPEGGECMAPPLLQHSLSQRCHLLLKGEGTSILTFLEQGLQALWQNGQREGGQQCYAEAVLGLPWRGCAWAEDASSLFPLMRGRLPEARAQAVPKH